MFKFVIFLMSLLLSFSSRADIKEDYIQLVYARYQEALTGAVALQNSINSFLEDPTQKNMDIVKQVWIDVRVPYLKTEAFRFYDGPIDNDKTGPEERINAWPLNEAYIDYVKGNLTAGMIQQMDLPITQASLKEKNQQKDEKDVATGWHAIEFLLWGQNLAATGPGTRPVSDYAKGNPITERRRAYLKETVDLLVADLTSLVKQWEPAKNNYAAQFRKMSQKAALSNILTGIASLSGAELALERMNNALMSGERLDQQSCFSDTTYQDFVYNQQGMRDVYMIVSPLVIEKDPNLDKQVRAQIDKVSELILQIPNPYGPVLSTPPNSPERQIVQATVKALQEQAELFKKAGKVLGTTVDIVLK